MRFIQISAVIFLILSTTIYAQQIDQITITGKITDDATGAPLENVNVFLANTTIGTATGKNGEYTINNVPFGTYDIIFSYIGYETEKKNFSAYKPNAFNYNISLKSKPINLSQVNVTGAVPEDWKENLKIFTRIFIGETNNAEKTKILNPEVLNFCKRRKNKYFKAFQIVC